MRVIDLRSEPLNVAEQVARALHGAFYSSHSYDSTLSTLLRTAARDIVMVAMDGDRFVGTATLQKRNSDIKLYASDVYVIESERKRGVATLLAGNGILRASQVGATEIHAVFSEQAPMWLLEFYQGIGFMELMGNNYVLFVP